MEPTPAPAYRAIVSYQQQALEIDVAPRRFGDVELPQKAICTHIGIGFDPHNGRTAVLLTTLGRCYTNVGGAAGILIPEHEIAWRPKTLVADHNTLIDLATGEQILRNTQYEAHLREPDAQGVMQPVSWEEQYQRKEGKVFMWQADIFQAMVFDVTKQVGPDQQLISVAQLALSFMFDADQRLNKYA